MMATTELAEATAVIIIIAVVARVASVLHVIRQTRLRRCYRQHRRYRDECTAASINFNTDGNYSSTNNNNTDNGKGRDYNDGTANANPRSHDDHVYLLGDDGNQCKEARINRTDTGSGRRRTTTATASSSSSSSSPRSTKTMIILGSGGHTTEMLLLLRSLDCLVANTDACNDYLEDAVFVIANSDTTSLSKLLTAMNEMEKRRDRRYREEETARSSIEVATTRDAARRPKKYKSKFDVRHLPRARELHQSYFSSIFTTLYAFYRSVLLLWDTKPRLILANGPGTCVPTVYAAFICCRLFPCRRLWRWVQYHHDDNNELCKIVYVESVCRVRTLSLSGKLVYPIADSFVVHWPKLVERYDMVEMCDDLVPCS